MHAACSSRVARCLVPRRPSRVIHTQPPKPEAAEAKQRQFGSLLSSRCSSCLEQPDVSSNVLEFRLEAVDWIAGVLFYVTS